MRTIVRTLCLSLLLVTSLYARAEAFNVFNHAQFGNPNGGINADSNFTGANNAADPTSGSFGYVTGARDPRIMQVALKLLF